MAAKVTVKRIGPGAYNVDAPSGVYEIRNCPADTSDPFQAGFRAGPRWMLTNPGRFSADSWFDTKRDAVAYIRTIEEEKVMTEAPATCKHGNTPRPDVTGDPIAACVKSDGRTEWGAFNAEGCTYAYDCAVDVANESAKENEEAEATPDDPESTWGEMCRDHRDQEQPKDGCEECFAETDEDEGAEDDDED
jgi:hypothetical protein